MSFRHCEVQDATYLESASVSQTEFILSYFITGPVGFEPTVSELAHFSFGG